MKIPSLSRWLALAFLGASTVGFVSVAASPQTPEEPAQKEEKKVAPAEDVKVQLGSLQVAVDPQTGDLRPLTKQEAARLANEMRRRFPPRAIGEPKVRPDGSLSAVVMPNVLRFSVANIGSDGKAQIDCAGGTEDAIEHLTHLAEEEAPAKPAVK
jgi:hypothetical protein